MAYTAWSVVFGEQPTAAKWNQLGTNDAGFKDGTNIDDLAIINRHIALDTIASNKLLKEDTTAVAFAAGWGSLSGHQVRAVRKGGWVFLFGIAERSSGTNSTIFTLPAGYRMAAGIVGTAGYSIMKTATTATASNSGEVNVFATDSASNAGQIVARNAVSNGQWISVSGLSFPCETY